MVHQATARTATTGGLLILGKCIGTVHRETMDTMHCKHEHTKGLGFAFAFAFVTFDQQKASAHLLQVCP